MPDRLEQKIYLFRDGMTAGELVKWLKQINPKTPIIVSSDEEQNNLFKGFYLDLYGDGLIIAGLTGKEIEDR